MSIAATTNESTLLALMAGDGKSDLYGQMKIYNASSVLVATVNLANVSGGLYHGTWTPTIEGDYSAVGQFYTDSGYTIDAGYYVQGENITVTDIKTNILRIMGLVHENSVVDQQTYDSDGNLVQARVRKYNNAANASAAYTASPAAYNTGLLFTWQVNAIYTSGALSNYSIIRVL